MATLSALGMSQVDPNGPTYKVSFRPYIVDLPKTMDEYAFLTYVDYFKKNYKSTTEYKFRQEVYNRNVKVAKTSIKNSHPESKLILGPNKFADYLPKEM